jgi:hypothetical protein
MNRKKNVIFIFPNNEIHISEKQTKENIFIKIRFVKVKDEARFLLPLI